MNYVQAFITNISFPNSLGELFDYGGMFNMEQILGVMQEDPAEADLCQNDGWTVPRWAKRDDIVFFFHSKTANSKISRLVTQLNNEADIYEEDEYWYLMNSLNRAKAIWRTYGGKVFAIGRVSGATVVDNEDYGPSHWGSNIYAPIDKIFVLDKPVDISEFNEQIMVSRQGAITPVFGAGFEHLKAVILKRNKYVWDYFKEAVSQPVPLSRMTKDNWLSVANKYRLSFILEAQFRAYYVDYLLPLLGDRKTVYRECRCKKDGCSPTWVDNVIHWKNHYLPVEVKLNVNLEKDLPGQCDQYMYVDEIDLSKDITVDGEELVPYVLVIDTEDVYLYDGKKMEHIYSLDDLVEAEQISILKEIVQKKVVQ